MQALNTKWDMTAYEDQRKPIVEKYGLRQVAGIGECCSQQRAFILIFYNFIHLALRGRGATALATLLRIDPTSPNE